MTNKIILVVLQLLFLASSTAQSSVEQLDHYIEQARLQWKVPGMAVTVVKDGDIILSKGYGLRSIQSNEAVNEETLFMLGSTTKAMTATAMAMLVDEGKVQWTDKVITHLPWFRLKDPYVTNELTVKDLFTHNSGLGNADLLWVLWDYSTEEIVRRLSHLDLSYSMRGGYTYQNIMYATAGLVIEAASGVKWSEFIHDRIFQPLGMTRSCALKSCAETFKNRSVPHYPVGDQIIEIIDSNADSIGAAGSAWSCSRDIASWMNFILDSTKVDGTKLVSKANFEVLQSPHIVIPKHQFYPTAALTKPNFTTYSLGWFQHDYRGTYMQFHTGSLNGSGAIIGLLPKHNLGVYVMVNLDHAEVRHAIMYKVFDHFMGSSDRDWSTELLELYSNRSEQQRLRRVAVTSSRKENTKPDFTPDQIVGTYVNNYLGKLTISFTEGQLRINCRADRHIVLDHWHYNTYMGKIEEYDHDEGSLVDFDLSAMGQFSFTLYGHEFNRLD